MEELKTKEAPVYQFNIQIKIESSARSSFTTIKRELTTAIRNDSDVYNRTTTTESNANSDSTIEYYIKDYFTNRLFLELQFTGNTDPEFYLSRYYEGEGSFIFGFTVNLINIFITYGSIRQSLDYVVSDLEKTLSSLLNAKYPITNKIVGTQISPVSSHSQQINTTPGPPNSLIIKSLLQSVKFLPYLFCLVLAFFVYTETSKDTSENDKLEQLVQKKVEETLNKEKLNFLFTKSLLNEMTLDKPKSVSSTNPISTTRSVSTTNSTSTAR